MMTLGKSEMLYFRRDIELIIMVRCVASWLPREDQSPKYFSHGFKADLINSFSGHTMAPLAGGGARDRASVRGLSKVRHYSSVSLALLKPICPQFKFI